MSNKILILIVIASLFFISHSPPIVRKVLPNVTEKDCGLAMGSKCQHRHVFACHQSNCTMNFYRRNATQGDIPWVVAVIPFWGYRPGTCTGSILNERWILTAAHCVRNNHTSLRVYHGPTPTVSVRLGYEVKQIKVHHLFNWGDPLGICHDIALLELKTPIVFGPDVCSVCLPPPMHEHGEKETALFAGYGPYDVMGMPYKTLQTGWVSFNSSHIYNNPFDYSQKPFPRFYRYFWSWFGYSAKPVGMFICLWRTPPDSGYFICQGDSGGPLVQFDSEGRAVQIGIAHSIIINVCDHCDRGVPKQEDIDDFLMSMQFTRVAVHLDWIDEQINGKKKVKDHWYTRKEGL